MCGVAAEPVMSPKVAAGQRHHLEVDARFHDNPAFAGLYTWAARALVDAGLPRGPARGAAHVGIELFLDGLLSGDVPARAAYARCLAEAEAADAPLVFADEPSASAGARCWRASGWRRSPTITATPTSWPCASSALSPGARALRSPRAPRPCCAPSCPSSKRASRIRQTRWSPPRQRREPDVVTRMMVPDPARENPAPAGSGRRGSASARGRRRRSRRPWLSARARTSGARCRG